MKMDGFDTTRAIRKSRPAQNSDVPIVAMTGGTGDEGRRACLAAGMNDHMPKPVGKKALAEVLMRRA